MPAETCPVIDAIIYDIEDVRKANAQLRECAEYWRERYEEKADEYDKLDLDMSARILELESELEP